MGTVVWPNRATGFDIDEGGGERICMICCALTPDFGVLASDSAAYKQGNMTYENPKMFRTGRFLLTYIGINIYLEDIRDEWFQLPMSMAVSSLELHCKLKEANVKLRMKEIMADGDNPDPNICFYVLGLMDGIPTLAEINSYNNYQAVFTKSDGSLRIAGILYGDDSNPEKQEIFTGLRSCGLQLDIFCKKKYSQKKNFWYA